MLTLSQSPPILSTMSLFATHTAWFDQSVPQDTIAQFKANGGHTSKSPTSPNTQLLFSLTPPTQPTSPSSPPLLYFHPHWVAASLAAGKLQPLSSHLLPPAAYEANANAVELHLQVASRMGEEWRKGQLERGNTKKRGRGRQQKKAKVLQDEDDGRAEEARQGRKKGKVQSRSARVDEDDGKADSDLVEVEPPRQQTRPRRGRSGTAAQLTDGVGSKRSRGKQAVRKRGAAIGAEDDLSFQSWPEAPTLLNGRDETADDGEEQKVYATRTETAARRGSRRSHQRAQHSAEVDMAAFGAFSSWFADPFAPPPPVDDQRGEEREAKQQAESEDEWEVEAVVDKRIGPRRQVEYRLRWKRADGGDVDDVRDLYAWVKASDCNCDDLIDEFERRQAAGQQQVEGKEEAEGDEAKQQQQHTQTSERAARSSKSKRRQQKTRVKNEAQLHVTEHDSSQPHLHSRRVYEEELDDEIEDDDVAAMAAQQSFGGWLAEPNFDAIIAELQQQSTSNGSGRRSQKAADKPNTTRGQQKKKADVEERRQESEVEEPLQTTRTRASAAAAAPASHARPSRAAAQRSRHAVSDMLAELDKSLDIDSQQADDNNKAAAATAGEDEVQEVEIHEEKVEGAGPARTLTVKHTILRRSPARLTSLLPFPAMTAGRQLFFPRGRSPARVELHDEHKHDDEAAAEEKEKQKEEEDEEENVVNLDEELLPCELCGVGIRADEYDAHVASCRGGARTRRGRKN